MGELMKAWLRQRRLWFALILLLTIVLTTGLAYAADPTGADTIDVEKDAGAAAVMAANYTWTLVAAFLVFFMQAGFALLEAGSTRSRNAGSVFMKNLMDFCMCGVAFWAFGFALMFGGSELASGLDEGNPLIGLSGFFLGGESNDVGTMQLWFFQMVFAATAATIVSGAMAERTKLNAYMAYSFLISAIIYPIFGHWMWGGGWLSTLPFGAGAKDFAGSGVVHAVGGTAALVGALMVGPRMGKFVNGRAQAIHGHNMGFVVLGTMILIFGWFGFNPGSTLAATDLRISVIAVNTFLAAIAGGLIAYYIQLGRTGAADIPVTCSGIIAGLVAVTAPCAYIDPWAAFVIGGIGGALVIGIASFLEKGLKLDDPVWAVACHAGGGLWGLLSVGIFANGTYGDVNGLIGGDGGQQLIAQLIAMGTVVAWTGIASAIVFGMLKATMGLRVSEADEIAGVDQTEFTQPGYVEDFKEREPALVTTT